MTVKKITKNSVLLYYLYPAPTKPNFPNFFFFYVVEEMSGDIHIPPSEIDFIILFKTGFLGRRNDRKNKEWKENKIQMGKKKSMLS